MIIETEQKREISRSEYSLLRVSLLKFGDHITIREKTNNDYLRTGFVVFVDYETGDLTLQCFGYVMSYHGIDLNWELK